MKLMMKYPSFLVMRSSLSCVALYGDYGSDLPSWRLGRFLEKWAISSAASSFVVEIISYS